ncbi:MAG: hypothetical protein V3V54_03425 [Candidatus Brocadiales bacterium]
MKRWLLKTTAVLAVGLLTVAGVCGSASAANVNIGGPKPGKAWYTDYWGISKEWQGDVSSILFTQSKKTAAGDPYHQYPNYLPEGSRIVSMDLGGKQVKVLTSGFSTAFDPCTDWDGKRFAFAGTKGGGHTQIWEMGVDGSNVRQLTDLPGNCRSPIYYPAGAILPGEGNIVWRDRYFEGDWEIRGKVEKTGFILFAYSPAGVRDEYYNDFSYQLWRIDPIGGKMMERITGAKMSGIDFPKLNTVVDKITYNMSSDFDPWLTRDGRVGFSSTQALGNRMYGKGRIAIFTDNWDGSYPQSFYGNCEGEGEISHSRVQCNEHPDNMVVFTEGPYQNYGVGQLACVKYTAPFQSNYRQLTDGRGQYRDASSLPDGRMAVSYAERDDFGIYWFDFSKGAVGKLIHDDPEWNDHQPTPVYRKYKPRWINTFTAGKNFGVTVVTYQPFDQVKIEGYPSSWGTGICFDTTYTPPPGSTTIGGITVGPYPWQIAKPLKQGDVKAIRVLGGYQCKEPDAKRFTVGAGSHLIGGNRTSSNSGTAFAQFSIWGYQHVLDDGSVVTSAPAGAPASFQTLDERGMALCTAMWWGYLRPYGGRICSGCHDGSYRGRAFKNEHCKALYNWWYDDRSHYDSPFLFGGVRLDRNGNYAGVKHGDDVVVPADVYYGGPSGTTSQPVEGLTREKWRTVDFRRDIQPIIDSKCANCHNGTIPLDLSGGGAPIEVNGVAAFSKAYNNLLTQQPGKDPVLGGKYVHPAGARNSLLIWRLYEDELSDFAPRANPFPREGRVLHNKFLSNDERYLFVEWADIGAQWDNIPGPDFYPGYRG